VLLSLIQIDVQAKYRIIDSKGNTTVTEADYHPVIGEIQGVAERELYRRFGFPGQVVVDPELRDKIVPFLSTNAELDRGSKIPFENHPYLYFLMHWVQAPHRRTDLDHSYLAFDSDWNYDTIFFGNQANDYISQSGDITNAPAPNGGTEYGRISLDRVPAHVRYIVPIINVYCGDAFADLPTAYAGFMFSDSSRFSLQREHTRYDLSQPAVANVPFVIDMEEGEIIIVDFNNRVKCGRTAHADAEDIKKVVSALKTKKFLTIGRFAEMLSGDDATVSLKIGEGGTHPNDLSELVS
jgi:stress response protein SCP2